MGSRRWLLYLVAGLTDFAAFLVVFTVARELAESDQGLGRMGLIGAVGALVASGANILFGRLSDRFGRRRMIVGGTFLMMISPAVVYFLHWYYLAYALNGIAAGMIFPSVVAMLSYGRAPGNGAGGISRTLIVFCLSWNLGLMSSQASGGWLFGLGREWPLLAAFCLAFVNLFAAALLRKPQPSPIDADAPAEVELSGHPRALSASFARLAWLANLGGAFCMSIVLNLFPKLAVLMDVDSDEHGLMIAMTRLLILGVYLLMFRFSFWHFRFPLAVLSQAIAVGGLVLLATATHVAHLWLGLAALAQSTGYNYFASLYYSTTGSSDERRASASGMHEATLTVGFAAGAGVGGLAGEFAGVRSSYFLGAAVIATVVCLQLGLYLRQTRLRRRDTASPA